MALSVESDLEPLIEYMRYKIRPATTELEYVDFDDVIKLFEEM